MSLKSSLARSSANIGASGNRSTVYNWNVGMWFCENIYRSVRSAWRVNGSNARLSWALTNSVNAFFHSVRCDHAFDIQFPNVWATFEKREGGEPFSAYGNYQECSKCLECWFVPADRNLRAVLCERFDGQIAVTEENKIGAIVPDTRSNQNVNSNKR